MTTTPQTITTNSRRIPKAAKKIDRVERASSNKVLLSKQFKNHVKRLERDFYDIAELRVDDREEHKRKLVGEYKPYIDLWIQSGDMTPNRVFSWFLVWLLDIGEIKEFIDYCLIGIERNQRTPDKYVSSDKIVLKKGFNSNLTEFFFDGVYDWSVDQVEANRSPRPYFDMAYELVTKKRNYVHKAVLVKMHVYQAKICFLYEYQKAATDTEKKRYLVNAIKATRWAIGVDKKAKCKTLHNKIVREMVKNEWSGLWESPESYPDIEGGAAK